MKRGKKIEDLTGRKFSSLAVIKRVGDRHFKCGATERRWLCLCDCGTETEVSSGHLKSGRVKSCGCSRKYRFYPSGKVYISELAKITIKKKEYERISSIWSKMRNRCYNPQDIKYKHYGGRGIEVCDEWKESAIPFYLWAVENGYKDGLTIERKDVNGDYKPSNCCWVTNREQQNNRRNNVFIEYLGERLTIAQWSRVTGLSKETISNRIKKGLPAKKVLGIEVLDE